MFGLRILDMKPYQNNDNKNSTVISTVALEIEHINLKSNGSDFSFNKLVSKTPELEFVSVRGDAMFL